MPRRHSWIIAAGIAVLAIFAADRVYSLSCVIGDRETLELEIQSVERGGEPVDDLSRWEREEGDDSTRLRATDENSAELEIIERGEITNLYLGTKE